MHEKPPPPPSPEFSSDADVVPSLPPPPLHSALDLAPSSLLLPTLVTAGNSQSFLAIYTNGTRARQSRIRRAQGRSLMEEDAEEKE
eukprot:4328703-Pyramimonas_sp.AAC.1